MNKKNFHLVFVAGCLACCGSLLADPLNNWHWRNPLPSGNPQLGAQMLNGIIFTNGTFFGVGNSGVVDTSLDATNWTQTISATSNQLNNIICGGGKFVAVGVNGTVETSSDGTNWVLQNSGTTNVLWSIAYGNGKYVAVGAAVISSADAVSWSPAISGLSGANTVAGNSSGFVALDGSTNAYFSTDGKNWTAKGLTVPVTGYAGNTLQAQIVTATSTKFIVGSFIYVTSGSVNMFMFTSSDGIHWTANALGVAYAVGFPYFFYSYFMLGNNQLIAAGQADGQPFLQFSPDGATWTQTNSSATMLYPFESAGAYGNGSYVIVGSGHGIYVSQDAVNWTNRQYTPPPAAGPASTFNSIACSNGTYVVATSSSFVVSTNDSVYAVESNTPSLASVTAYYNGFVGAGSSGQVYQSTNGLAWYQHTSATANNLHGVTYGNNLLVAVGDNGTVQTSPTGVIWTIRSSGTSLALYSVAYSNGLYVAVGQQGTVVTSLDGMTWTVQDSTVLQNLLSVTYGSTGFLAVGPNSTIVTSPDGVNWTQQNPGVSASFNTTTYGDGYYLVAGNNAVVLTSPDGMNWTSRNVGATSGPALYGSGFFTNRFDVVGANGVVIESDPILLIGLQIQRVAPKAIITATVVPGTTFRIQSCSSLASPGWTTVATFNNPPAVNYWTNSSPAGTASFYRLVSP
jgi:hypothetical protein